MVGSSQTFPQRGISTIVKTTFVRNYRVVATTAMTSLYIFSPSERLSLYSLNKKGKESWT